MDKDKLTGNKLAVAIAKAIAATENGGKVDMKNPKAGKTGEAKSIFQFTPATWKNYSMQAFGKVVPMNADTETAVVLHKVNTWLDKGYQPEQIASMWNAGTGEPDAYSGKFSDGSPSKGINRKYGVQFDVPSYAKKVKGYMEKYMQEQQTPPEPEQDNGTFQPTQTSTTTPSTNLQQDQLDTQKQPSNPHDSLVALIKKAQMPKQTKPADSGSSNGFIQKLIGGTSSVS